MTQRGNDWPIDPAQTSGTELATVLNRMVSALDSTNHTDNTGDRPDYAVKGTMWLDGDVSEQNLGLKMFTGNADALLFNINDQTGEVTHPWKQLSLEDGANIGYIRQTGTSTEHISSDGVVGYRTVGGALNVASQINIGFNSGVQPWSLSIRARDSSAVKFYTYNSAMNERENIILQPGKLSGGTPAAYSSLQTWMSGTQATFALPDGGASAANTGFFVGDPRTPYWGGLQNNLTGQGTATLGLVINRNLTYGDMLLFTIAGATVTRVSSSGQVSGTGPFVELSDASTKDVRDSIGINPQDVIMGLNVRRYLREGGSSDEIGFVAQEVQQVLPGAVVSFEGENYWEDLAENRKNACRFVSGEEPTDSELSEIESIVEVRRLGVEKSQINAVLLAHVQDLTRRLEALENP